MSIKLNRKTWMLRKEVLVLRPSWWGKSLAVVPILVLQDGTRSPNYLSGQTVSQDSIAPTLGYNLALPDSCSPLEDVPAPVFGRRILEWWIEGMVAGTQLRTPSQVSSRRQRELKAVLNSILTFSTIYDNEVKSCWFTQFISSSLVCHCAGY